jgi:hypothetical protein
MGEKALRMPSENILTTVAKTWRIMRSAMPVHATFYGFKGIFVKNHDEALRASIAQWIGHQKDRGPNIGRARSANSRQLIWSELPGGRPSPASNTSRHGGCVNCS